MPFLSSLNASRKFIDLIKGVTTKWANWDPGHSVKVGDFGTINRETGEFEVQGNIYEDEDIYEDKEILTLVKKNLPSSATRENEFSAATSNATRRDLTGKLNPSIPGLAEATIKGKWSFYDRRGALLIMALPQSSYIPPGKVLNHLEQVEALKDMLFVTQVFSCPAYALYLSGENQDEVSLALIGSASIPHAPPIKLEGGIGVEWWSSHTSGLLRHGNDPEGKDSYMPLFTLRKIRERFFWSIGATADPDDLWYDPATPWGKLDEDGNEVLVESTGVNSN